MMRGVVLPFFGPLVSMHGNGTDIISFGIVGRGCRDGTCSVSDGLNFPIFINRGNLYIRALVAYRENRATDGVTVALRTAVEP